MSLFLIAHNHTHKLLLDVLRLLLTSPSSNDFARVCNRYKLNYKVVMEYVGTDGEGCFSLDSFIHYLKKCQSHSYTNHVPSGHSSHAHDVDSYVRSTSPPPYRPPSASKVGRQSVHSGEEVHNCIIDGSLI